MLYEIAKEYRSDFSVFRPYASASDRKSWKTIPQETRHDLIKWGEQYLEYQYPWLPATKYMEFCRIGDRAQFEELYFYRRRALNALVMAECIEGKRRFMDDIVNGIMAICEESGWQLPAHNHYQGDSECIPDNMEPVMDLFACETAAQMAMTSYLLKEELNKISSSITKRIHNELEQRILEPYLNKHFFWMGKKNQKVNNWTPWCTQNTLIAVFSMEGIDRNIQQRVLEQAAESLDIFLDVYGEDGCCNEGPSYFRVAGLCLFNALEVMNAVTSDKFASVYQNKKIKNIAEYILNVHINDTYYANFADCSPICERAGVREFLFAKRVNSQNMMRFAAEDHKKDGAYLLCPRQSENLFYRLQAAFTEAEISSFAESGIIEKTDKYYESVGLFLARDSKYFLAVKAGSNDDSHNHNDTGSVIVYKEGKPFLIDVGVETYSRKTFSPQRYEIWTMQSAYHNVLTFKDIMQKDGPAYASEVLGLVLEKEKAGIYMELASCYPEGTVKSYKREVEFNKEKEIRITDSCNLLSEGTYLSLMTLERPEWSEYELKIGSLGIIHFQNSCSADIEEITISDPKLYSGWGDRLYRTKIYLNEPQITFIIK